MSSELPFPALPYDNNLQIASYLNLYDLLRTRLVSKLWKRYSFWCVAAVDTTDFEQLVLKCNILLNDYINSPTVAAQEFIAEFFSRIVKTKMLELENLQKKIKENFERYKILADSRPELPDALEDAPIKYPRLLMVVQELSTLTHTLSCFNLDLEHEHKIRPVLSEFTLWFDYAENFGRDIPKIYFDYWQLFTGVICYQNEISIKNACLYNISISDDVNSTYFEDHLKALEGAAFAYNIRFIGFQVFGDFDRDFEFEEDPALVEMNRRSQLRICEKLQQERLNFQKEFDQLMRELLHTNGRNESSEFTSSDPKDREIANLRIQLRLREIEIEIQKMLLKQTPSPASLAIQNGYDYDNTKMTYYDKIKPGYLNKRNEINSLIMENIQLRERIKFLKQQLEQVVTSPHILRQDYRASEPHAYTTIVTPLRQRPKGR